MPTKAELEQENADLRAQLASAGVTAGCCDNLCPCGVPYSRPCYSHVIGDMVRTCICPDHPEQTPAERVNA